MELGVFGFRFQGLGYLRTRLQASGIRAWESGIGLRFQVRFRFQGLGLARRVLGVRQVQTRAALGLGFCLGFRVKVLILPRYG